MLSIPNNKNNNFWSAGATKFNKSRCIDQNDLFQVNGPQIDIRGELVINGSIFT